LEQQHFKYLCLGLGIVNMINTWVRALLQDVLAYAFAGVIKTHVLLEHISFHHIPKYLYMGAQVLRQEAYQSILTLDSLPQLQ